VFASTREIYGQVPKDCSRLRESDIGILDPSLPRNSYPESKRMAEAMLVSSARQFSLPYTILRISHTYGPGMEIHNDGRIMADIIGSLVRRQNIVLTSDGSALRSFCYISDCVDGILRAMLSDVPPRLMNLANETEPLMVKDLAQLAVDCFPELNLSVEFADSGLTGAYSAIPLVPLDTSKIESLGWRPLVSLTEGLRRTVLSYW
jgi:nucleoside-diphosphate-sugar epimerase